MNYSVFMKVLHPWNDLMEIVFGLDFRNPFATLDEFIQGLVGAHLENDIDVAVVFEEVVETHNMRRFQGSVNFYFWVKLY